MATISECRDAADRHGLEIRGEPTGKKGYRYNLFRNGEFMGTRQSAGALMNLIKTAVPAEQGPERADDAQTVRNAYQAALAELDMANAEIGRLRAALQEKDGEISTLKSGICELTENKHNKQRDMEELLNTVQNQKGGIEDTLAEILERLSGMEKRIGLNPAKAEKRKALNIGGWTIHRDPKGFHRAFRNIRGTVRGVYIGKDISDVSLINIKLTKIYQKYTSEILDKGNDDVRADRGRELIRENTGELLPESDRKTDQVLFRRAYDRIGKGRGFVRIHRLRECLNWEQEKFDRVLQSLLADYSAEIHRGDPSILTEQELADSYQDETGTRYITVSFWKEPA